MITQFVLIPAALWWTFMGFALWVAARRGRLWVLWMSGLGLFILIALGLQVHAQQSVDGFVAALDGIVLWLTLPIAACGQALLTWWMLRSVSPTPLPRS